MSPPPGPDERLEGAAGQLRGVDRALGVSSIVTLADANGTITYVNDGYRELSKLAVAGVLAAGVAHEVNNPLAGVIGCVEKLREGSLPSERREEFFTAVGDGLERIRDTVQALLEFARPHAATRNYEDVDVADVVASCLLLIQPQLRKKQLNLDLQVERGDLGVRGSRSELLQATMNVLLNAIHASPHGATIVVGGERVPGMVEIRFVDHGSGIPGDVLPRVTEPFFTTKDPGQGTGLGLSVTLAILEAHGGRLAIESPEGAGTIVTFRLPAAGG